MSEEIEDIELTEEENDRFWAWMQSSGVARSLSFQLSNPAWEPSVEALLNSSCPMTFRREGPKVGRNDPCPCGSGKKFKKCCGSS